MRFFFFLIVIVATLSFYLGITLPLMVFEKFFFFESESSLIQIILQLWHDKSWPLALVIGLFSVVLPALKLVYLFLAAFLPIFFTKLTWLSFLSTLSKWSMMDVLVVALIIVATKTSGLAKASAQAGLWFFLSAVILMAFATYLLQKKQKIT